ncbi:hypothetical protein O0L34_g3256 [Tuta absoluta]|nr:hypothetical protein O0L34_g3256 [Tuta absoluta]
MKLGTLKTSREEKSFRDGDITAAQEEKERTDKGKISLSFGRRVQAGAYAGSVTGAPLAGTLASRRSPPAARCRRDRARCFSVPAARPAYDSVSPQVLHVHVCRRRRTIILPPVRQYIATRIVYLQLA